MSGETVYKVLNLGKQNDYVYDNETERNDFNCGVPLMVQKTDSFVLAVNIKDLNNLEDLCDFINLDKKHELLSNKNKKVVEKFEIETPKNIWIDEFVCLRGQMYSFKCGDDIKNKLKCTSKSQSKHNKLEEYKKFWNGEEYQRECNKYILLSQNHEMYLRKVKNLHYPFLMINDVI